MSRENPRATSLQEAIYVKADEELKEDVEALSAQVNDFLIKHGAGMKAAFRGGITKSDEAARHINISITKEATTSTYEADPFQIITQFKSILTQCCVDSFRDKKVREFVDKVGEIEELTDQVEWLNENTVQNP